METVPWQVRALLPGYVQLQQSVHSWKIFFLLILVATTRNWAYLLGSTVYPTVMPCIKARKPNSGATRIIKSADHLDSKKRKSEAPGWRQVGGRSMEWNSKSSRVSWINLRSKSQKGSILFFATFATTFSWLPSLPIRGMTCEISKIWVCMSKCGPFWYVRGSWTNFSSAWRLKTWHGLWKLKIEDVVERTKEEDVMNSYELPTQNETIFDVEANPSTTLGYLRSTIATL